MIISYGRRFFLEYLHLGLGSLSHVGGDLIKLEDMEPWAMCCASRGLGVGDVSCPLENGDKH